MPSLIDRMTRAAKLQPAVYDEAARDEGAMNHAIATVVVSAVAAGIGSSLIGGPIGLVGGTLAALVGWFIWAFTAHFVGTRFLAEPGTRTDLAPVLRAAGFAAAPGVIRVFGIIPLLGTLVNVVANIWMLAAFVVAVRQALGYASTGRAVAVCLIGFAIQMIVFGLFTLMVLGGAFMTFAR